MSTRTATRAPRSPIEWGDIVPVVEPNDGALIVRWKGRLEQHMRHRPTDTRGPNGWRRVAVTNTRGRRWVYGPNRAYVERVLAREREALRIKGGRYA